VLAVFGLAYPATPAAAAESISVLSPGEEHFAGQSILFHVQTREFTGPVRAAVFYRTIGVLSYRKLEMDEETPLDFTAVLPSQKAAPPGIEYFFSLEDSRGNIFTFPEDNPRQNPYRMDITLDDRPPSLTILSPSDGSETGETRPSIEVQYADDESAVRTESVRILVDGVDVTPMSDISEGGLVYQPGDDLSYGKHTVTVELEDMHGNRMPARIWSFAVARTERFRDLSAELNISGQVTALVDSMEESAAPEWTLQSNVSLKSRLETESVKASFTANMFYQEEEGHGPAGDTFSLTNYLLDIQTGGSRFLLGDLSARGSELLSPKIARRGGLYGHEGERTSVEVFTVSSNAVTGFDHMIGFDDPDNRITGGSVSRKLTEDGRTTVTLVALSGKNETPDDYNASTLQPGTSGQAYSLGVVSRLAGDKVTLTGEVAGSRYDPDLADGEDLESDTAYLARISGRQGSFTWGGSYRYLGADYRSIAKPTGASDRAELTLNGGYRTSASSFTLNLVSNHDNVDNDPSRAVISNNTGSFNYTFSKADWPMLFVSQTMIFQESSDEPVSYTPLDNKTYTATLGASYGRKTWNVSPSYTLTLFDDQGPATDNDSATRVLSVSGSYRPSPSVSLSPVMSLTTLHTDADGVTTEMLQGALSGRFRLKGDRLTLNTTLSSLDTNRDDGLTDMLTFSGIAQLNWKVREGWDETFSLKGQYSNNHNRLTGDNQEDYTIYALFSFGLPVTLY